MKLQLLSLLFSYSTILITEGAISICDSPLCEYDFDTNCAEAFDVHEFTGDCCSLKEVNGTCIAVTNSSCSVKLKGDDGCTTNEDGTVGCVIPGMTFEANGGGTCPEPEWVPSETVLEPLSKPSSSATQIEYIAGLVLPVLPVICMLWGVGVL